MHHMFIMCGDKDSNELPNATIPAQQAAQQNCISPPPCCSKADALMHGVWWALADTFDETYGIAQNGSSRRKVSGNCGLKFAILTHAISRLFVFCLFLLLLFFFGGMFCFLGTFRLMKSVSLCIWCRPQSASLLSGHCNFLLNRKCDRCHLHVILLIELYVFILSFLFFFFFFLQLYCPNGFLPWEIQVAFPWKSQLWQSRATQPTAHAGCFSVSIIHQTLTWTTRSL